MILLNVFARLPEGDIGQVGELAFGDPDAEGRYECAFRYGLAWLRHPRSFALDPESLPLSLGTAEVTSRNLRPPLSVFDDALPDEWGRSLLIYDRKLARGQQSEAYLLRELGADSLGCLMFAERGGPVPRARPEAIMHLDELIDAAERFDAGRSVAPGALRRLLAAGSTPGGVRPKALVEDGDGVQWIAKLPSRHRDLGLDVVGLEASCMRLAEAAGVEPALTRLERVGERRALLVRRFDVAGAGRLHMLSLRTLCRERPDYLVTAYADVMAAIRKHSADPAADVARFFRQMTFNLAVGNTDEHLKNFWMLRSRAGWRLSPAIDLIPDIGGNLEHALVIGLDRSPPAAEDLHVLGRTWKVPQPERIVAEVVAAARSFPEIAAQLGVAQQSIGRFAEDIAARCRRLQS